MGILFYDRYSLYLSIMWRQKSNCVLTTQGHSKISRDTSTFACDFYINKALLESNMYPTRSLDLHKSVGAAESIATGTMLLQCEVKIGVK